MVIIIIDFILVSFSHKINESQPFTHRKENRIREFVIVRLSSDQSESLQITAYIEHYNNKI
jgi:hypothetical protein